MRIPTALLSIGIALTGCSKGTDGAAGTPGGFKPVATTLELMRTLTIPSSNTIFAAQGEAPQDDAGWLAVQNGALLLAESGNLLIIGPRARDQDKWRKDSLALIDAAAKAVAAARAKNAEQLAQAADAIYMACEGCHQDYLPK